VRNLIEEAGRSQCCPTPMVGKPVLWLVMLWDWRAAIMCTGQQNPAKSAASFVQCAAYKKELCSSAQNVMWVCA
jgi:hypothetical protein